MKAESCPQLFMKIRFSHGCGLQVGMVTVGELRGVIGTRALTSGSRRTDWGFAMGWSGTVGWVFSRSSHGFTTEDTGNTEESGE